MYILIIDLPYFVSTKFFNLLDALNYGHKSKRSFIIKKNDKIIANIKENVEWEL
jgi:hypothetical protein